MAYQTLQDLNLGLNFTARDIDITNFNAALRKLELFVNTLNTNMGYSTANSGEELPSAEEYPEGAEFIVLE